MPAKVPTTKNAPEQPLEPLQKLRALVQQAFPDNRAINSLTFRGTYTQAWETFARMLDVSESELAHRLAPLIGIELATHLDRVEPTALRSIPFAFCQKHHVLPLRREGGSLLLATANPFDRNVTERISFLVNSPHRWVLAAPEELNDAILAAFSKQAARDADDLQLLPAQRSYSDDSVVLLGRALLESAIDARASDLHIQHHLGASIVRIRVDGELRRLTTLSDAVASTLIRHCKVRAGMDPTNALVPQDGRISMVHNDRPFDLRVSSLPTSNGERLVIRFLDQSRVHRLSGSGFSLAALQMIRRQLLYPSGLLVMTGPTGSGKTSTLYGMLAEINHPSLNIMTVENPVEYRIPGISQVDINDKSGRSFATTLRSILRQDPDVILIGEIRDEETAEIALQAALTGHLVLTTLHTNDAVSTIPRLIGLGISPAILADSLIAIISQRLCRRLCPVCKINASEPLNRQELAFLHISRHPPGCRPVGCEHCSYTGYFGRLPLSEVIEAGPQLRDAIATGESRHSVLQAASGGLKSLAASGGLRVVSGETTIDEVIKTVGHDFWQELARYFDTPLNEDVHELFRTADKRSLSVVLITSDNALTEQLNEDLHPEGLKVHQVTDAEAASALFRQDESISFVIMDIAAELSLEQAVQSLREAGRTMYWSRLPALVLLPPAIHEQEEVLRQNGMISPCLSKPVTSAQILAQVHRSFAR